MLNLRVEYIHANKILQDKLLDENISKLDKSMKQYLEQLIPLEKGPIFNRISYDNTDTRMKLLHLVETKKLSLKVIQLEIKRRKRMKIA